MSRTRIRSISRRSFVTSSAACSLLAGAPALALTKKGSSPPIVGSGAFQYEVTHAWPQLPSKFSWQTTHNVAVDGNNHLYVIHEGHVDKPDHPSIFVFDQDGKYVRSFGSQFQGGGHGIEVRTEGSDQFLYVCGYQQVKSFAKLDLNGEVVWQRMAPMEAGVYAPGEDTMPEKKWGRDRFMPTNFAFLPDGGFFLADGYGSFHIHRYDKHAKWISSFGGPGGGEGTFNTPHGLWIDDRPGGEPHLVVTDRAHNTLQILTLDGKHVETLTGYGLPANIDIQGDLMLVPELKARVTILGQGNRIVAQLGDDVQRISQDKGFKIRGDESQWLPGRFVHPHDACFDATGNIFVAEWVASGRVSKLRRLS